MRSILSFSALILALVLPADALAFGGRGRTSTEGTTVAANTAAPASVKVPRNNGSLIPGAPAMTLDKDCYVRIGRQLSTPIDNTATQTVTTTKDGVTTTHSNTVTAVQGTIDGAQVYVNLSGEFLDGVGDYMQQCSEAEERIALGRARLTLMQNPIFQQAYAGLLTSVGTAAASGQDILFDITPTGDIHFASGKVASYQEVRKMYEAMADGYARMAEANAGHAPNMPAPPLGGIVPGTSGFQSAIVNRQIVADRFRGGGGLFQVTGYDTLGGGLFPEVPNFYENEGSADHAACTGALATCQGQVQSLDAALSEME